MRFCCQIAQPDGPGGEAPQGQQQCNEQGKGFPRTVHQEMVFDPADEADVAYLAERGESSVRPRWQSYSILKKFGLRRGLLSAELRPDVGEFLFWRLFYDICFLSDLR